MKYPIQITGKILTFAPQYVVRDAAGVLMYSLRQKRLALQEDVKIYRDKSQSDLAIHMTADRIIDFNACYHIKIPMGLLLGTLERKGTKSLWQASYEISRGTDQRNELLATITEVNPWAKVFDSILGAIPIIGDLICLLLNPAYVLKNAKGFEVYRIEKRPAFFERKFVIERKGQPEGEEQTYIAAILMMILLEWQRG